MSMTALAAAEFVRARIPGQGLFAGMTWRIAPKPFRLEKKIIVELEKLGRVLLQFNRAHPFSISVSQYFTHPVLVRR